MKIKNKHSKRVSPSFLQQKRLRLVSKSIKETRVLGRMIARHLRKGDILCLFGEIGAGKTVLTKGIASGLGLKSDVIISPTFVLLREYNGRLPFYHFDFYRLNEPRDIAGTGYEEYFYNEGVSVVEWPQRLKHLMPDEFLKIELKIMKESTRILFISGRGMRYEELLEEINADTGS